MRRFWTSTELDFLRRRYPDLVTWAIALRLNRPESSVYGKARAMGLEKSEAFKKSDWSGGIQHGQHKGRKTQFKPGHSPHNKGKKGWSAGGRSAETRFKPGNRPHTWVPVGSQRITKDGIRQRKVSDTGYTPRDWKSEHGLLWEKHRGPIPAGHIVVFKNGDRSDIRIENLETITRAENMNRNTIHNLPEALVDVCRIRGVLNRHINKRTGKNEKQNRRSSKPSVCHHRGIAG